MEPKIIDLSETKLVGMHQPTSLANDQTRVLWQQFMPRRQEVQGRVGEHFYSMNIYATGFQMKDFTPQTEFEKWAAVAVIDFDNLPQGMETITVEGKYAVFHHKGPANTFPQTLQYIHGVWLPGSEFQLDDRPHFEILGVDYVPTDPNAEEDVYIPIR
ncbi:MAG TPA: GyrI-like domain-containing protein [Microscillaceae bacterium]|nr:GyrI-like domain-containing protein [Microscillaceae bacterium]